MKLCIGIILIVAVISTQGRSVELRNKRQTNKDVGNRFLFPDAFMSMHGGSSAGNTKGNEQTNENERGNESSEQGGPDPFTQFGIEDENQQSGNQQTGSQQTGNQGDGGQSGNQGSGNQTPTSTVAPTTTSQPPRVRACIAKCPVTSEFAPICGSNRILYYNLSSFNCAVQCGVDIRQLTRSNCP